MEKKKTRRMYLAVKTVLLALAIALGLNGMQSLLTGGCEATTAVSLWLSGALMWGFATLEE